MNIYLISIFLILLLSVINLFLILSQQKKEKYVDPPIIQEIDEEKIYYHPPQNLENLVEAVAQNVMLPFLSIKDLVKFSRTSEENLVMVNKFVNRQFNKANLNQVKQVLGEITQMHFVILKNWVSRSIYNLRLANLLFGSALGTNFASLEKMNYFAFFGEDNRFSQQTNLKNRFFTNVWLRILEKIFLGVEANFTKIIEDVNGNNVLMTDFSNLGQGILIKKIPREKWDLTSPFNLFIYENIIYAWSSDNDNPELNKIQEILEQVTEEIKEDPNLTLMKPYLIITPANETGLSRTIAIRGMRDNLEIPSTSKVVYFNLMSQNIFYLESDSISGYERYIKPYLQRYLGIL